MELKMVIICIQKHQQAKQDIMLY
ncbi:hypothetical protein SNE40_006386 [Patella caerulea]|uniref:Uncharacterized protein n=1 Tax=Patella caerulea TaxID=87958 RepID=A0AAN8K3L2_PATCE